MGNTAKIVGATIVARQSSAFADPAWSDDAEPRLFRPRKEAISIRVDTDLLTWLRRRAPHYQTEINAILRAAMDAERATPSEP